MADPSSRQPRFRDDPARAKLLALYAETDRALASFSCANSTECCQFGVTGREPYPTAIEVAELEHAIKGLGGAPKPKDPDRGKRNKKALPMTEEEEAARRCAFLSTEGRCRIYASRPFGCRTFFCERASSNDGKKMPRAEIQSLSRKVAELSAQSFDRDPGPRTLESALDRIARGESVLIHRRMR